MPRTIDLNADLGEGCGNDDALLALVTSANVAAGAHAGGGVILEETISFAVKNGVAIGAHPSYPDRENFGRVSWWEKMSPREIQNSITSQIVLVAREAWTHGARLSHIKPHGALYNDAVGNPEIALVLLEAISEADLELSRIYLSPVSTPVLALPFSHQSRLARASGRNVIREGFADRTYEDDGSLTSRKQPHSVLHDSATIAERVVSLLRTGEIVSVSGKRILMEVDSICIHGDNAEAVEIARSLKAELHANNFTIEKPSFS